MQDDVVVDERHEFPAGHLQSAVVGLGEAEVLGLPQDRDFGEFALGGLPRSVARSVVDQDDLPIGEVLLANGRQALAQHRAAVPVDDDARNRHVCAISRRIQW